MSYGDSFIKAIVILLLLRQNNFETNSSISLKYINCSQLWIFFFFMLSWNQDNEVDNR